MILCKNFKCPYCSFLSKVSLEIVFGGVFDRKQAFLDYKNISIIDCCRRRFFLVG